jgi:hypothetical protein
MSIRRAVKECEQKSEIFVYQSKQPKYIIIENLLYLITDLIK